MGNRLQAGKPISVCNQPSWSIQPGHPSWVDAVSTSESWEQTVTFVRPTLTVELLGNSFAPPNSSGIGQFVLIFWAKIRRDFSNKYAPMHILVGANIELKSLPLDTTCGFKCTKNAPPPWETTTIPDLLAKFSCSATNYTSSLGDRSFAAAGPRA